MHEYRCDRWYGLWFMDDIDHESLATMCAAHCAIRNCRYATIHGMRQRQMIDFGASRKLALAYLPYTCLLLGCDQSALHLLLAGILFASDHIIAIGSSFMKTASLVIHVRCWNFALRATRVKLCWIECYCCDRLNNYSQLQLTLAHLGTVYLRTERAHALAASRSRNRSFAQSLMRISRVKRIPDFETRRAHSSSSTDIMYIRKASSRLANESCIWVTNVAFYFWNEHVAFCAKRI